MNLRALGLSAVVASCADATAPTVEETYPLSGTVAVVEDRSCALGADSLAYCWGSMMGLGYNPSNLGRDYYTLLRRMLGGHRYVALALGPNACGITPAGEAYCWGREILGDGTTDRDSVPRLVAGGIVWAALSGGQGHWCGVAVDGAGYCWGGNIIGQLGSAGPDAFAPVAISGSLRFTTVSAGGLHSCGVATDGRAYCWGANDRGQLGVDSAPELCGPTQCSHAPVLVAGGVRFATISAGAAHTCGVTTTGGVLCWGANADGELGLGHRTDRRTPAAVTTPRPFAHVSAGDRYTCGRSSSGEAYCWGYNVAGRMGVDPAVTLCIPSVPYYSCSTLPVAVTGGLQWQSIDARFAQHTCGAAMDGLVRCWGTDYAQQLGVDLTTMQSTWIPTVIERQPETGS